MSDGERGSAPAGGQGPDAGAVILGIFFLLFGICILLVGGGCTILWVMMLASSSPGLAELGLLLLSLAVAVGGIFSILFSIRLFRGPPSATSAPRSTIRPGEPGSEPSGPDQNQG